MSAIKKYTLNVLEKVHETNDSCTIKFKQPGLRKIAYQAGQFITLIVQINGRMYQRPYSISSVFGIDPTLNITVKAVENGVVSNYIKHTLSEGQTIEIIEPLGTFTIPDAYADALVLWAAGSGISPIFALLKKTLIDGQNRVVLNYSSKNIEHTILLNEILNLQQIYSDRFEFHLFLSEAHEKEKLNYYPRMDAQHVELIGSKINNSALHFICGPDSYSKFVKTLLLEKGILENNIRTEDFSLSLSEADMQGVADVDVDILIGDDTFKIPVRRGLNILSAALDSGLKIDYSCQTGTCELCSASILSGSVRSIIHQHIEVKNKGENCLLCCSLPLTDNILISLN